MEYFAKTGYFTEFCIKSILIVMWNLGTLTCAICGANFLEFQKLYRYQVILLSNFPFLSRILFAHTKILYLVLFDFNFSFERK